MHSQRLKDELIKLRTKAAALPDGFERDELMKTLKQHESSFRLIEWIIEPANQSPPFDVVKIRMYRLQSADKI